jgi:CheY-like chemotaxis protein
MQHVLIVDPDVGSRRRLALQLEFYGWPVHQVRGAAEAVVRFQRSPAALVVMDLELEGLDPFEACQAIRASTDRKPMLVGMSRGEVGTLLELCMKPLSGFDLLVQKPLTREALRGLFMYLDRRIDDAIFA